MPDLCLMTPPPAKPSFEYKTARAAEWFWLVAASVTTLYVRWMWWSESTPRYTLGLFPCIAWLWYLVRRIFRKRMQPGTKTQ